jgi:hypothetical protein
VFENRVLRRILGLKRDEVTEGWRKLQSEDLHNMYFSRCTISMIKLWNMRWTEYVARMEKMRNAYRILVGKPEG